MSIAPEQARLFLLSLFWPGALLALVNKMQRRRVFSKFWLVETLLCAILTWWVILLTGPP